MDKYGINNVRGGVICFSKIGEINNGYIETNGNGTNNRFKCSKA